MLVLATAVVSMRPGRATPTAATAGATTEEAQQQESEQQETDTLHDAEDEAEDEARAVTEARAALPTVAETRATLVVIHGPGAATALSIGGRRGRWGSGCVGGSGILLLHLWWPPSLRAVALWSIGLASVAAAESDKER
jgi:hypothetical protein